jgi:hypothetical protein
VLQLSTHKLLLYTHQGHSMGESGRHGMLYVHNGLLHTYQAHIWPKPDPCQQYSYTECPGNQGCHTHA